MSSAWLTKARLFVWSGIARAVDERLDGGAAQEARDEEEEAEREMKV
jgi:hypothetical protein